MVIFTSKFVLFFEFGGSMVIIVFNKVEIKN